MHAKARSHHASSKPTWHRDGAGPEAAAARPVSVALALGTGSRAAPGATTHATSLIKAACSQPVTRPSHWRCIARHFCVKLSSPTDFQAQGEASSAHLEPEGHPLPPPQEHELAAGSHVDAVTLLTKRIGQSLAQLFQPGPQAVPTGTERHDLSC